MKSYRQVAAVLWSIAVVHPASVLAQTAEPDSTLRREAQALLHAAVEQDRFSGVTLLARNGARLVAIAGGLADRERGSSVALDTRFNLASGDKLFTKIAILQLVQAGRLALSDTVGKFLPDYANPAVRQQVTVEHLLRHRSGLGSYWGEAFQRQRTRMRDLADLVPLFEQAEPAFEPGSRMQYSNNGYVVLGRIIEVVTGRSFYDYVAAHIFEPAGMTRTAYLSIEEWPADKAIGYTTSESLTAMTPATPPPPGAERVPNTWSLAFRGSSAGGGYSTAADLLALDAALRRGTLVDAALLDRFTATAPGGRRILANGGGAGANFELVRIGDYTIIVLSNYDPPAATQIQQQLIALLRQQ